MLHPVVPGLPCEWVEVGSRRAVTLCCWSYQSDRSQESWCEVVMLGIACERRGAVAWTEFGQADVTSLTAATCTLRTSQAPRKLELVAQWPRGRAAGCLATAAPPGVCTFLLLQFAGCLHVFATPTVPLWNQPHALSCRGGVQHLLGMCRGHDVLSAVLQKCLGQVPASHLRPAETHQWAWIFRTARSELSVLYWTSRQSSPEWDSSRVRRGRTEPIPADMSQADCCLCHASACSAPASPLTICQYTQ